MDAMPPKLILRAVIRLSIAGLALTGLGATSCSFSSDGGNDDLPRTTVVFHFRMHGDVTGDMDFRAATQDPQVIATVRAQLAKTAAERRLFISGPIERGHGTHNRPWRWHFVPDAWRLTSVEIELCDGNAVLVDQAVDYWVDTVGTFCPWGSYVAAEIT